MLEGVNMVCAMSMKAFISHWALRVLLVFTFQKYDYDSSTVRKKFFREALLQIFIPYMLQQLSPSCSPVSRTQHNLTAFIPVHTMALRHQDYFPKKKWTGNYDPVIQDNAQTCYEVYL